MELQEKHKLIFGLSPISTFINAAIILAVPSIVWVYNVSQMFISIKDFEAAENFHYEVPWYINFPLLIISFIMFGRWMDYKFGKLEFGFSYFFYRFIVFLILVTIYEFLIQLIGLNIVLK